MNNGKLKAAHRSKNTIRKTTLLTEIKGVRTAYIARDENLPLFRGFPLFDQNVLK